MLKSDEKYLILTHGIPGVGKSTFVANHFGNIATIICPDNIREEFSHEKENWKEQFEYRVWCIASERMKQSLKEKRITIMDATFIERKSILKQYKVMKQVDPTINFMIIDFSQEPLEICLQNNKKRKEAGGRFVPEDVIVNMYKRIKRAKLLEFEPMTVSYKDIM